MAHKHKGCIIMQLQSVIIQPWRCEDVTQGSLTMFTCIAILCGLLDISCEETQRKSRRKECYQSGYGETNKRSVLDSIQPILSCRYEEKSRQVFG